MRASATGIGAKENGEAPRPLVAAHPADALASCTAVLEDALEDLVCEARRVQRWLADSAVAVVDSVVAPVSYTHLTLPTSDLV